MKLSMGKALAMVSDLPGVADKVALMGMCNVHAMAKMCMVEEVYVIENKRGVVGKVSAMGRGLSVTRRGLSAVEKGLSIASCDCGRIGNRGLGIWRSTSLQIGVLALVKISGRSFL
jgi:hypothetical protein